LSKDKDFVFINSGTKEDSEVSVVDNRPEATDLSPRLLIERQADVRVHIDHVREMFLIISNNDTRSKNFKL